MNRLTYSLFPGSRTTTGSARVWMALVVTTMFGLSDPGLAAGPVQEAMTAWFTPPGSEQAEAPACIRELGELSRNQVPAHRDAVWAAYRASPAGASLGNVLPAPLILGDDTDPTSAPHELPTGDKIMPFYFVGKGDLDGKRALFIALHGGGSAGGRAPSPHGWGVNTREWNTQARLAAGLYPTDALYFVPRMADDNDGRWYYTYCQDAYDQVIRAAILHHRVDPNRVYLIGISEGAYTAYRLGAFMADRWAGAGSMAGGEPLQNAPPENLRNLAFRADIGERDTMFDRIGLNQRYGQALDELQGEDPDGFVHHIEVQAGRGHGIDYRPCPEWLFEHTRNPRPTRVRWKVIDVHGRAPRQSYWLAINHPPETLPVQVDARIDRPGQAVYLTVEDRGAKRVGIRIYLDDDMLDLDRPVRVIQNGTVVFEDTVPRRVDVLMRSLAERGDPSYMFPAEVILPPLPDTGQRLEAVMKRVSHVQSGPAGDRRTDVPVRPKREGQVGTPVLREALSAALETAGDNRSEWLELLETVADEHLDSALFLVQNMPPRDLQGLTREFVQEHIEKAHEAWENSPWGNDIPREIFLQYVLPYAHFNEQRENWRNEFMDRLQEKAWSFTRPVEATIWLNTELNDIFQVYFHARKRPKPDQSPSESIAAGYASCSGLSILLADSCRSVGIPARLVGIPRWTEIRGNHTWVEIWDEEWHNVGGTGSDPRDDDWVNQRCRTQTDPDQWQHSVYAACFRQTDLHFPLVWDMDIDYVPALNVTRFYSAARDETMDIPGGGEGMVSLYWSGELIARKAGTKSVSFSLADGLPYQIRITTPDGQVHHETRTF